MPPLVLEGTTLGQRHQHYNQLLKDATSTNKHTPAKIDYDKTDIENLFNIDIASNNRDVEYILDVLKGQDMLYVSRAIKRSNWLINDDQFAHIINPEHLHLHLFLQMMPKASCKLLLHIRLTLKKESRVEVFFQYFREKNLKTALKWLPNCSISFIEDAVRIHGSEISAGILKRLCERSSTVLEMYVKGKDFYKTYALQPPMFLLNNNTELYLDVLKNFYIYDKPEFGKRHTEIVMKKCPHRFIDDFETFKYIIDLDTFAKYFKKEDIQSFLLEQLKNKETKSWFNQDRINTFIKYMPKDGRFEFMKKFIDRSSETYKELEDDAGGIAYECAMSCRAPPCGDFGASNSSTYGWYKHAPFDVAFVDLKKMIRSESNPDERNAMLMILVSNARRNLAHIHSLLRYYRERHINEPFRFKVQFVNHLLQKTAPNLYSDKIWNILDEIFRSLEVYVESGNNVQTCVKSIIVYKVTHDEPVPDVIEQKFNFDSLKPFYRNMNQVQKDKVFNYLFNVLLMKLNKHEISDNAKFAEYVEILKLGLNLLKDWKKELIDYQILITKIKDSIKIKKEKEWDTSLTPLYDIKKSWRKYIFEDSLALAASENVCMNALKHDPELLTRYKDLVDELCCTDTVRLERVLGKLRVYWPDTMASEWTSAYRERLDKPGGHKALVRGLCSLLNQRKLLDFLKKYEPLEAKINWADINELELSLRKNIAQSMHIARPQITPEAVLWYAKGDYVQFAQPSLNAILYNLRSSHSRKYVLNLLSGIISLQKHGIRLAFAKLSTDEIKQIFLDVWKSNKNSSVRAALFQNTHEFLCRERDEMLVTKLWELMETLIDDLSAEENKTIYNTFSKLAKVHPKIKPTYCMKSYKFLKSLPPKADCKKVMKKMKEEMYNIIEELDSDFVADIILEFVEDVLLKKRCEYYLNTHDMQLLTSNLLRVDDESTQFQRYEKVLIPLMDKSISSWDKTFEQNYYVRQNFSEVIERLFRDITDFVLKQNKVTPTALFRNVLTKLENSLPVIQNYNLFRQLKLAIALLDVLDKNKSESEPIKDDSVMEKLHLTTVSIFVNKVVQYLKEDIGLYGPSIDGPYARALEGFLYSFNIPSKIKLKYLVDLLNEKDCIPIYLLGIKMLEQDVYYEDDIKPEAIKVHKMLQSHPFPEVQIYYFEKFGDIPLQDDGK